LARRPDAIGFRGLVGLVVHLQIRQEDQVAPVFLLEAHNEAENIPQTILSRAGKRRALRLCR
jgi:hypothetical protein